MPRGKHAGFSSAPPRFRPHVRPFSTACHATRVSDGPIVTEKPASRWLPYEHGPEPKLRPHSPPSFPPCGITRALCYLLSKACRERLAFCERLRVGYRQRAPCSGLFTGASAPLSDSCREHGPSRAPASSRGACASVPLERLHARDSPLVRYAPRSRETGTCD